jgi:hypothetical protein
MAMDDRALRTWEEFLLRRSQHLLQNCGFLLDKRLQNMNGKTDRNDRGKITLTHSLFLLDESLLLEYCCIQEPVRRG